MIEIFAPSSCWLEHENMEQPEPILERLEVLALAQETDFNYYRNKGIVEIIVNILRF